MARGSFLRETIMPLLDRHLTPELDAKAFARYEAMKERYGARRQEAGGRRQE
jgi:hypothetical protein